MRIIKILNLTQRLANTLNKAGLAPGNNLFYPFADCYVYFDLPH
jgi:hypothetical protein